MTDNANLYEELMGKRDKLLEIALNDSMLWCGNIGTRPYGKKHSDQYWMEKFGASSIGPEDAKKFLTDWQLVRASWQYDDVSAHINKHTSRQTFSVIPDIERLAQELRAMNKKNSQQTSAASKISMLAYPDSEVFIWDSLATHSARIHQWNRLGRPEGINISAPYERRVAGERKHLHDYASYWQACKERFEEERKDHLFTDALEVFKHFLKDTDGRMKNASDNFIARRFLDKLMYWEGDHLEHWVTHRKDIGKLVEPAKGLLNKPTTFHEAAE